MLIINACIAGAAVYTGLKTVFRRRAPNNRAWLATPDRRTPLVVTEHGRDGSETQLSRACTISPISLGLSIVGTFGYPALSLASVPLTVYSAIPVFEQASTALFAASGRYVPVVWSAAVIGTLVSQHYIAASLLTWLYGLAALFTHRLRFLNDLLMGELAHNYHLMTQLYGAKPPSVWVLVHGVGMEMAFAELKVGDTVLVRAGEVVPISGTIVDGTAAVTRWLPGGSGQPEDKGPGDRIVAPALVVSGSIGVRAESI